VPARFKAGQKLYTEILAAKNLGGVWHDIPVNRKRVTPHSAAAVRTMAKLLVSPLACSDGGRDIWHVLDRRLFAYWIDPLGNCAVASYARVVTDWFKFRNSVSWLTDAYLRSKGLDVVGRPKFAL
jgi:hypothetical protein